MPRSDPSPVYRGLANRVVDVTPGSSDPIVPPETRKWYRLGIVISIAWAVFVAMLLVVLEWNLTAGLAFAVVASVVFGVVFMYVVRFVY